MATSFRTDGFPVFLLRAHTTLRNAGEFIKLSHNSVLQTVVDVKTARVSVTV